MKMNMRKARGVAKYLRDRQEEYGAYGGIYSATIVLDERVTELEIQRDAMLDLCKEIIAKYKGQYLGTEIGYEAIRKLLEAIARGSAKVDCK